MILVVGATGTLGGMITRRLLEQGREVRILVRPQSAYQSLVAAGAQPVLGDLKDPASLAAACQGVDAVITTANSALRGGADTVETVDRQGNHNLIAAAQAAGVGHFIFTSAASADLYTPVPFLAAKAQTEESLRLSGMPYTILAPDTFMEVWVTMVVGAPVLRGEPVTLVGEGRRRHAMVAMADVAAYAVAALDNPAARNQRILIGGPTAVSWVDVIATFERVLGHPIAVERVEFGAPVPTLPPPMWPLLASFEIFDSEIDMTETARLYGVTPTPLEAYVRQLCSTPIPIPEPTAPGRDGLPV